MSDLNEYKTRNAERERLLDDIREQIRRDEQKIHELDESISEIRHDINVLKQTIEYLRGFMP